MEQVVHALAAIELAVFDCTGPSALLLWSWGTS
jgi:hypothetical protein